MMLTLIHSHKEQAMYTHRIFEDLPVHGLDHAQAMHNICRALAIESSLVNVGLCGSQCHYWVTPDQDHELNQRYREWLSSGDREAWFRRLRGA